MKNEKITQKLHEAIDLIQTIRVSIGDLDNIDSEICWLDDVENILDDLLIIIK